MVSLRVVTGYVPIQGHPRSAREYGELGSQIFAPVASAFPVEPFYAEIKDCWLWRRVHAIHGRTTHSTADNPAKNTLAYHCVQHQKFGWLLKSLMRDPTPETYVWMDYGIGHVPGVDVPTVFNFLASIQKDDFAIPGCLPKENALINDFFPCWRFCGGLMVVPREWVKPLYDASRREIMAHVKETKNVWWEVNTLARVERVLPIRWYKADHDETMFTGYPCAVSK